MNIFYSFRYENAGVISIQGMSSEMGKLSDCKL